MRKILLLVILIVAGNATAASLGAVGQALITPYFSVAKPVQEYTAMLPVFLNDLMLTFLP
jgi:hypothetical protein